MVAPRVQRRAGLSRQAPKLRKVSRPGNPGFSASGLPLTPRRRPAASNRRSRNAPVVTGF